MRWLVVTGLLWALPLLLAPPLAGRDPYSYLCQGWLYADGANPYLVTAAAGGCPWLESVAPIWRDTPAPYGPLAIVISAAVAKLGSSAPDQIVLTLGGLRLVALAGAALTAVTAARLATVCGIVPVRAVWLGLVTPLVAIHVVSGAHNDAIVTGLVMIALAAAAPAAPARSPWLPSAAAGLALGLAVAVKLTALVALPFVVLLVAGRFAEGPSRRAVAAAGLAAAGGFAAVTMLTGLELGWLTALSDTTAIGQWTSIPTAIGMSVGYLFRVLGRPAAYETAVAVARLAGLALLACITAALVWRAWRHRHAPRTVIVCCGATFAALSMLSPVFYPWYAITPLAILASSVTHQRARQWIAGLTVVLVFLVLPNGLGLAVLTKPAAPAVAALVLTLGWVIARRHLNRQQPSAPTAP
jgi:hypothetical protein